MANNILKTALLLFVMMIAGCTGGIDYVIHGEGPGETVYVEVEVPTYILVEVPTGIEYGEIWVDSFIQPLSVEGVDILWIIDTSGSMNVYDPRLIAGIEAMMNALPETGWRLAMLSNDPAKAVKEAQFPLIPGDDVADALNMYSAMLRGGREEGFDAAYEYIVNNTYASTWMRHDAALLVVFVSDEEEQSDDHFVNLLDFTNWYGGLRNGSVYLASINNVAKADSVCAKTPSSLDIGHRYMDAVNHFGGTIVDICSEDWSAGVTDASTRIEPYESLELTHVPSDIDSIRVFINGSLSWNWYYEPTDNTVYFTIIPGADDLVEIAYHYDVHSLGVDTGDTGQ
tara:strand:+ start:659 stop:1681 length:1023 start_codon:yes stop_codon:yes gene_type:complete